MGVCYREYHAWCSKYDHQLRGSSAHAWQRYNGLPSQLVLARRSTSRITGKPYRTVHSVLLSDLSGTGTVASCWLLGMSGKEYQLYGLVPCAGP